MKRAARLSLGLALALLAGTPAQTCTRDPADAVGYPSAVFIAGKMMNEAAFADIALAETRRKVADGAWVETVTFRTIKRIKGASPDRFTLFAPLDQLGGSADTPETLEHWVDEQGRVMPLGGRGEAEPPSPTATPGPPPSSCGAGQITPELGRLYIVFRGPDGRALRSAEYHEGTRGPTFPVVALGHPYTDMWHLGVAQAGAKLRSDMPTKIEPAVRRLDVAKILLRTPMSADAVNRLLRGTGATPFAVQTAAGEFVDETRVPYDHARAALIEEALSAAKANFAVSSGPAAARKILAMRTADDPNSEHLIFERGLHLLNAEARLDRARTAGEPRIVALELRGTPDSWRRLGSSGLVAQILLGFDLERGAATPPTATRISHVPYVWSTPLETVRKGLEQLAGS